MLGPEPGATGISMSYAAFLLIFLLPPAVLLPLAYLSRRSARRRALLLLPAISLIALLYTTPWDNYLVANQVWWYAPDQISGILLGWVPLEEYLFFVLQPVVAGSWTLLMLQRPAAPAVPQAVGRRWPLLAIGLLWAAALIALLLGNSDSRYLALILGWALPPLALQLAYGAGTLWRQRRAALLSVLPTTLYLAVADSLAISLGIWTISPLHSTGWLLFGVLPVEELLFFLLTNCLVAFSVMLLAPRLAAAAMQTPARILEPGARPPTAA